MGCESADSETIRQLRLAETFFNHSVSCLVILDRDYNFVRVNQAYAQACRRGIEQFVGYNHFELYPSDAKQIFDEVVRTKRPFATFTRAFEFVDQPERGVTYWDWTLVPVLDGQDDIEYLVFSLVEVTERKRAEEALRIAALVYQHSSEAMVVTDSANKIIAINEAFTRLTGYAAGEVLGHSPNILNSGRQCAEFYREMWQKLDTTGQWQGELWDRNKNGNDIALRLTINTVADEAGKVDLRVALFSDVTEKKLAESLIWEQANFDALTKLPNRYQFNRKLEEHIGIARIAGTGLAMLLIDLDEFKEVNDTLGHDKGDMLLIEVTRRIIDCLRGSATLARLGGDEFIVVLSDQADLGEVKAIAKKIIAKLVAPFLLDIDSVFISASIGIVLFPEDGTVMEDLLRHADLAMYAAKKAGRNRYCYFTPELQDATRSRMNLTNDLRCALAEKQFEVYYQPIVELATGSIRKGEALLRWKHPTRGLVSPLEFIALAESSGLILEIGEWVFRQAAEQVRRMRAMGYSAFQLSVNVSPVQLRSDSEFNNMWLSSLGSLGLPPQSMVIEITESLLLDLSTEIKEKLIAFAAAGIQVALDDFGTGYSSLAYLKKFDIDYLKIDRAFINNLETDSDDRALCEAIIMMAHKLGLRVIAEGIETVAQRNFLAEAGCDFAQGYLFSKPVPAAQFEALLR